MQLFFRAVTLAFVFVTGLAACGGSGSGGDDSATTPNNLVVSRSIAGVVTATANGGSRTLTLGFNSSDAKSISNLQVAGLSTLPAGWSGAANFSCATVGSGNGCLLNLAYAPTAIASGTLALTYTYSNNAGESASGSIDIPFAATVSNNVVATASPAGQVAVVVDSQQPISQQTVVVTFTPDDGNPASALSITSGLPSDWVGTVDFTCATVTADGSCHMMMAYTPVNVASGTLELQYSYLDNSGTAKTGTLNIPYIATTANNVVATASPSATIDTNVGDLPQSVTLIFTTDDGNLASGFAITSVLPNGWTGTPGFSCGNVDAIGTCTTTLHYQPSAAASGVFNVAYSYSDNSGAAKTGSINISYSAKARYAYVASTGSNVDYCVINGVDGSFGTCVATATSVTNPTGLVLHDDKAYISNASGVYVCDIGNDGSLSTCAGTGSGFQQPSMLASSATHLYATSAISGDITVCSFAIDGSLANCAQTSTMLYLPGAIAINNDIAYVTDIGGGNTIIACAVSPTTAQFFNCVVSAANGLNLPTGIELADQYVYVANFNNNTVSSCAMNSDGTFATCSATPVGNGTSSIAILGDRAYVTSANDNSVSVCALNRATGVLSSCVDSGANANLSTPMQIRIR